MLCPLDTSHAICVVAFFHSQLNSTLTIPHCTNEIQKNSLIGVRLLWRLCAFQSEHTLGMCPELQSELWFLKRDHQSCSCFQCVLKLLVVWKMTSRSAVWRLFQFPVFLWGRVHPEMLFCVIQSVDFSYRGAQLVTSFPRCFTTTIYIRVAVDRDSEV